MATPQRKAPQRKAPSRGAGGASRTRPAGPAGDAGDAGDDLDDEGGYAPRRRTVRMNPLIAITFFSLPVILAIGIGVVYYQRTTGQPQPTAEEKDDNVAYDQVKAKVREAKKLFMAAAALRESPDQVTFNKKVDEAKEYIFALLDEYDRILEPVRDPDDGQVPAEFNEYMVDYQKLQTWVNDLSRIGGF